MLNRALLLVVMAAMPIFAQTPKKAWTLTVEERIALRTDAKLARERLRDDDARQGKLSTQSFNPNARQWVDAFTGQTHPELFLPFEVFRNLISVTFLRPARDAQMNRKGLMPEVSRHGLPEDFWQRLEALSAPHISDLWAEQDLRDALRQQRGAARQRTEQAWALKNDDICRSRADALAAARREFGRERFDRFLYETVAVNMFHAADKLHDPRLLARWEEGCR